MIKINSIATEILSTLEAAKILGVTQRTVQLWTESGTLIAWKTPGGHRKVTAESVNQIMKKRNQTIQSKVTKIDKEFNVLYVEDDEAQRLLFQKYFSRSKKIKLVLASNGFEGLLSIGKEKPNLLISDLKMPWMDGFEMINQLKKNKELSGLEIVVLTSMNEQEITEHGGLPTDIKIFMKPVSFKKLDALIDRLIISKQTNP
jgi:excisionase family DNA binding protein